MMTVQEEMQGILDGTLNPDELMHYGMPRRSGRYPWGSGDDPYQHGRDFLGRVEELKKNGWTETPENIKKEFGLTTTQYRIEKSVSKAERRALDVATAKRLRDKEGLGATEIGRRMGMTESTVRSLFNDKSESRMLLAKNTAKYLKEQVDKKGMIDVGAGVHNELNISKEKLDQAIYLLQREGYELHGNRFSQVTNPGQMTTQRVLCPPGTPKSAVYDLENVHSLKEYISRDGGETFEKKFHYPASVDSKRIKVVLADEIGPDGEPGIAKDGIIQLRRGVPDLSLGDSHYSQVRILVDGEKYLKGMAVYSDNIPDGYDMVVNTNKATVAEAYKKLSKDPDNPFGSLIKDSEQGGQYWYDPKTGNRVSSNTPGAKLGAINKRADEGDWSEWSNALPSQFLGKQSRYMAKKQLDLAKADKEAEFDDICALTNPTIKKHLLNKFADNCDSAAVHLKAAALPGQKYHVIIPINTLKDTEVYAPNYKDGTKLALIRYPHGGTFEIPILTVNNKNVTAKKVMGNTLDAVGINSYNAGILSGADFDGDTVMCIPTHDAKGNVRIKNRKPLPGLEGFEPRDVYRFDDIKEDPDGTVHYYKNGREFRPMKNTQTEMGKISNLITDMTLANADDNELAAAVRHSMVVIDAEKHKLDYKQSEKDNNITALKKKYQPKYDENGNITGYGGAATILSRAKGEYQVDKRQGAAKINRPGIDLYDPTKPLGSLVYKTADDVEYSYEKVNKRTGEVTTVTKRKHQPSTRMAETDDAHTLVSEAKHPMELLYADYANSMKAMANRARMEMLSTGKIEYSSAAKATYKTEVDSLMSKLNTALLNAPREREANRKANIEVAAKKAKYLEETGENMKKSDIKKLNQQALSKYRNEVQSVARRDRSINITDREWDAIQAGAVSENVLTKILSNADVDQLRERATPRTRTAPSAAKINQIKRMNASNYTIAQIAEKLNLSTSTVSQYLKGVN